MEAVLPYVRRMSIGEMLPDWTEETSEAMGVLRIEDCEDVRGPL